MLACLHTGRQAGVCVGLYAHCETVYNGTSDMQGKCIFSMPYIIKRLQWESEVLIPDGVDCLWNTPRVLSTIDSHFDLDVWIARATSIHCLQSNCTQDHQ